jgi:hypothetical protein
MYRETKARFRRSVRFWGIEGGVIPLTASGLVSLFLLVTLSQDANGDAVLNGLLTVSPFALTYGYMWVFRSNRRPYMDRDLFYAFIYGRSVSPEPSSRQPVHPVLGRIPRTPGRK